MKFARYHILKSEHNQHKKITKIHRIPVIKRTKNERFRSNNQIFLNMKILAMTASKKYKKVIITL